MNNQNQKKRALNFKKSGFGGISDSKRNLLLKLLIRPPTTLPLYVKESMFHDS